MPDNTVWNGHVFAWKRPPSWMEELEVWLRPRLRRGGVEALRPGVERDLCWDDEAWIDLLDTVIVGDLDGLLDDLAESLGRATLRTYHGTRTHDAGTYFREGLKVHDRERMTERVRSLVDGHDALAALRGERLSEAIDRVGNQIDHGRAHVAADDAFFLKYAAHYLIYGSEWIMAVLGGEGRHFLRTYGTPTLLEIDLPLSLADPRSRHAFARVLLREWVRLTCNRTAWTAPIDFGFRLATDIPPSCIVGHRHPQELRDPLENGRPYRPEVASCLHCATPPSPIARTETAADAGRRVGG